MRHDACTIFCAATYDEDKLLGVTTANEFLGAITIALEDACDGEQWYTLGWRDAQQAQKVGIVTGRILVEIKGLDMQRKVIQDAARSTEARAGLCLSGEDGRSTALAYGKRGRLPAVSIFNFLTHLCTLQPCADATLSTAVQASKFRSNFLKRVPLICPHLTILSCRKHFHSISYDEWPVSLLEIGQAVQRRGRLCSTGILIQDSRPSRGRGAEKCKGHRRSTSQIAPR